MTDEQWIEFNAQDDGAYCEAVRRDLGLEIDLAFEGASAGRAAAAD